MNITIDGGLTIPRMDNHRDAFQEYDHAVDNMPGRMNNILDGGHHMDDLTMSHRMKYRHDKDLPCYRIYQDCAKNNDQQPALSAQRLYGQ